MHRTRATHDLRDLVDNLAPKVEAAVQTVAEKAPPAFEHGKGVAAEKGALLAGAASEKGALLAGAASVKGAQLAEALAERIPDSVVDRLPDTVSDRLPIKRSHRGRKLLLIGGLVALAAVIVSRLRGSRSKPAAGSSYPRPVDRTDTPSSTATTTPSSTPPAATETPEDASELLSDPLGDPLTDPINEPGLNGRSD